MRLALAYLFLPILSVLAFLTPWIGAVTVVVLYYVRPSIWGAPGWFQPVEILTLVTLLGIVWGWLRGRVTLRLTGIALLLLFLVGSAYVSAEHAAISKPMALARAETYLKCAVFAILLTFLIDSVRLLDKLAWATVFGTLWLVKSAVVLALSAQPERVDSIGGQGGGANFLAAMLVLSMPILLVKFQEGTRRERVLSTLFLPLWILAMVLSGSRGGFLAMGLVLFLYVWSSHRRGLAMGLAGFAVVLLVLFAPKKWVERMESIGDYDQDLSASYRIELWEAAVRMANEHPVRGVGPDNFQLLSTRYTDARQAKTGVGLVAHNTYLQTLAEQGWPGFLLLLVTMAAAFAGFRRASRGAPDTDEGRRLKGLARAFAIGFAGYALQSMFLSNLHNDVLWWYLALGACCPVAAAKMLGEEEPAPSIAPGSARFALASTE